jgi:RNA polymerase sigma factor (sigma-70 family)
MHDDGPDVATLVAEALQGRHEAWESLVRRYAPLVLSVARRYGLTGHDAQDVAQTVWLRLVEHLGEVREPRALPGWISVTTRNECLRLVGQARRSDPVDALDIGQMVTGAAVDDAEADHEAAERHIALLTAFSELSDRQRDLLLLLMVDPPLPYAAISRRLGIPVGSIGPTRKRALARLRRSAAIAAVWEGPDPVSATTTT